MVKQRFVMHFKPWLFALGKAGALILGYQLLDQIRTRLQHPPLNIADVLMAATAALFALALFCALWAWGEWCWFRFRSLVGPSREFRLALRNHRKPAEIESFRTMTGTMS